MKAPVPPLVLGRGNPRLAEVRAVARGEDPLRTILDGEKLVRDAVAAGLPLDLAVVRTDRAEGLEDLLGQLSAATRGAVFLVSQASLEQVAPTRQPQGVLAVVRIPRRALPMDGTVVYLDRVQDPGNVGAVIRSAAALGAGGVACSPGCADPFSPRAVRGSALQSLLLPVARDADFGELARAFAAAGGEAVATVGAGGTPLPHWRPASPLLLALGNEGQGLAPEILSTCSVAVTVALSRGVESLNVAVTAGVLLAFLAWLASSPILKSKA
jgi:RNA methyltransferase, TrmH family